MSMSDEQIEKLHQMFADSFRRQATTEDALLRQKTFYARGLDIIRKLTLELDGVSYMEPEDYACCRKCGEKILDD